jgi:hypothetical protein
VGATISYTGSGGSAQITMPVTNNGTISVDHATLYLPTSTVLGDSSTLVIGITTADGTTPVAGHISFQGAATLAGTLAVSTAAGYSPPDGTHLSAISGTLSGQFAATSGLSLPTGQWTVSYDPSNVTLTASA